MKATPMTQRPDFSLLKQTDIQAFYHLQMPRWLFSDGRYRALSLEAKVTYSFLLNRFQLSKLNGWINDNGEVFIIYTRESLSAEIQISYKKVIESMKLPPIVFIKSLLFVFIYISLKFILCKNCHKYT